MPWENKARAPIDDEMGIEAVAITAVLFVARADVLVVTLSQESMALSKMSLCPWFERMMFW
jgi:hypothetical protein